MNIELCNANLRINNAVAIRISYIFIILKQTNIILKRYMW